MATRRVVLCLGDETVAGRPIAEFDPGLTTPQTDFQVWDIQSQAWEDLTPGSNSNSTEVSDKAGLESFLREALRADYPTETLYLIKYATAGDARDWAPGGSLHSALITQVTAAGVAANGSGDDLSIDAVVLSVQLADHQQADWRSYGTDLQNLISTLPAALDAVAFVSTGTLRNDSASLPFALIEPHYKYTAPDARLVHMRMQAQQLGNEKARVRVIRSDVLLANVDGSFVADSCEDLGALAATHLKAPTFDDSGNGEAKMVLVVGDSVAEGTGTDVTSLPDHHQVALSNVNIWRPDSGQFLTLQAGAAGTNSISVAQVSATYGLEIGLCDRIRDDHEVFLVKASQTLSSASYAHGELEIVSPIPHGDRLLDNWDPELAELALDGWFISAAEALRSANRAPSLDLVVVSMGLEDARSVYSDPNAVADSVRSLRSRVLKLCETYEITTTGIKFIVLVPAAYAASGVDVIAADLSTVRSDLLALPDALADVVAVDLSNHESTDSLYPNDAGTATLAKAVWDAYRTTKPTTVHPMFAPSMLHLKKALRLSQVPEENDAWSMIDSADQMAKAWFFRVLGQSKIEQIQSIAYTTDPKTQDEHVRNLAVEVEIKMVRAELLRTLPLMFKDGSSVVQTWNDEGAFRDGGFLQTENEIKRLRAEINESLEMLNALRLTGAASVSIEVTPDDDNALPGDTIFKVV